MPGLRANPGFWSTLRRHLNFFRIHLLFFTFTPLICSVIIYVSNERYPIPYIDALYNSVSAMTVCGLATVNLSQLTPWQQSLLFVQMCLGSPVLVSWFMVYIRRHFFAKKFQYIIQAEASRRAASKTSTRQPSEPASATERPTFAWRLTSLLPRRTGLSPVAEACTNQDKLSPPKTEVHKKKLRTDMIRRMDAPLRRINPSGWVSEGLPSPLRRLSSKLGSGRQEKGQTTGQAFSPDPIGPPAQSMEGNPQMPLDVSDSKVAPEDEPSSSGFGSSRLGSTAVEMRRTATVEFAPTITHHYVPLTTVPSRRSHHTRMPSIDERPRRQHSRDTSHSRRQSGVGIQSPSLTHSSSQNLFNVAVDQTGLGQAKASETGLGGFPMPHQLLGMLFRRLFPRATNRLRKTWTIPAATALSGGELGRTASVTGDTGNIPEGAKPVSYLTFDAIVGRNSTFHMLTNEQLEELGGVEYRGLNALLWLVLTYHLGSQLVAFAVIGPYMAMPKWASDFVPPALIRPVATPWFSLFQVVSTYTNTGFSLVDQSMIPFQTAYPMIFFMIFLILAGNTAFPVFFRFMIWVIAKSIPTRSRLYETLHFLLDHPRRCFVYLFPAHQTWFLFGILTLLNSIDFFCFMVLNIGNPEITSIPFGTRFAAGLLQAVDVRASGFSVVTVAALAPAVQVMYVIMMYISVYPIAMSVRATNVYEEQSLGIFHSDDQLYEAEQVFKTDGSRIAMWGRYLAIHARYQLSFDMWWLALALFLVCIIERDNLMNPKNQGWFNIFSILFEIASAYGSVGLSLGIPTENYSLSGAFRPLSKLILCLVMIRGRHRGLPVAIDRAIVLPYEFERVDVPDPPSRTDEQTSRVDDDGVFDPIEGSADVIVSSQSIMESRPKIDEEHGD